MTPQGSKSAYSTKQKRMASHIEHSAMKRGRSRKTAGRIAWATVNKKTGGAKGRSARKRTGTRPSRGGRKTSRAH